LRRLIRDPYGAVKSETLRRFGEWLTTDFPVPEQRE
jgi:hypothetical protein